MTSITTNPEHGDSLAPVPSWNGHPVRLDSKGRLALTDMWKATGAEDRNHPSKWLANKRTQGLVAKLEERVQNPALVLRVVRGDQGGTWAHVNLAVAYAEHLSPEFWLWVTDTFLAAGDGRLVPAAPAATPPELLAALARLDRMEASVEAMHATVGEVIRPAHVRDRVRQDHRAIVTDMDGGRCPCCGDNQVVERVARVNGATFLPEWTGGYCVSRYRGVHLAGLRDTWPVCWACRYRLFSREFHRDAQPNFDRYQRASVDGWLRKRRPDLFGAA